MLIGKGALVNSRESRNGATPLMVAAFEGHEDVVRILLEAGADVNAKDAEGNTALSLATTRGHQDVIKLLKAKGAK